MLKKVITALIMVIGLSAVTYIYANRATLNTLNAQSAPAFQLPKGSKVVLGTYNGKEIVWDIGNDKNDFILLSSTPLVDDIQTYDPSLPIVDVAQPLDIRENSCLRNREGWVKYCPVKPLNDEIANISLNTLETTLMIRNPFLPELNEIKTGGRLGLSVDERAFKRGTIYWVGGYISTFNAGNQIYYNHAVQLSMDQPNSMVFIDFDSQQAIPNQDRLVWTNSISGTVGSGQYVKGNLRPYAILGKTKILFAANTSYTDGAWHDYQIDTTNFNENNE